jgi:hypothetical protein
MAAMTAPTPGDPRRLDRPPSDRFRLEEEQVGAGPSGSIVRAALAADGMALAGAALTVVLGGVLALSAGLLVLWASVGSLIGHVTRWGGGSNVPAIVRVLLAVGSAVVGVTFGQVGLWLYAGLEGGVLPLVDHLAQTYGILVPLQVVLAAGFAWWSSR